MPSDEQQRLQMLAHRLVCRHYEGQITLAALSTALSSSPRQVQRAYASCGGTSFSEDLRTVRMQAAAQLLLEYPTLHVEEVAARVGYRQSAHFIRAFQRVHGVSPQRFRIGERERQAR
ncbi:MAG TPA: helix-turn-helix transcriptional regulator [Solirubrobacteraceae bacterium]